MLYNPFMHQNHKLIIGHRGACRYAPENTLESFDLAFSHFKVDMIEFDVHASKDGVPVIIHDEKLGRTTDGTGRIDEFTLKELKNFDAGYRFTADDSGAFPWRGRNVRIPALSELFERYKELPFAIEIKDKTEALVKSVLALVAKYDAADRCIIGSEHDPVFIQLKQAAPHIRRFLSRRQVIRAAFDFHSGRKRGPADQQLVASLPLKSFGFPLHSPGWIQYLQQREIDVYYWGVKDEALLENLIKNGADGLIVDDPGALNRILGRGPETAPIND